MKLVKINKNDIILLKKFISYVKPYKLKALSASLFIMFGMILNLIQPILWGKIVVNIFEKNIKQFLILVLVNLIVKLLEVIVGYIQTHIINLISNNIIYDLKNDMFDKILELPVKAFDEKKVGELMSYLYRDSSTVSSIISNQFLRLIVDNVRIIILIVTIFMISPLLSFIVLISFPLCSAIYIYFGHLLRKNTRSISKINDIHYSFVQQSLTGIREIIVLGVKDDFRLKYKHIGLKLKHKELNSKKLNNLSESLTATVIKIINIIIIVIGGYYIINNKILMEYYIAFISYSMQIMLGILSITKFNSVIQQLLVSIQRVFNLLDGFSYNYIKYGNSYYKDIGKTSIIFKEVCFSYKKENTILENISFDIEENKTIAIIGKNGCGKSTILNLILRLYEPNKGSILIGEEDIRNISEKTLRSLISVVRQQPFLFNISINDNLRINNHDLTQSEIVEACKKAEIHDFIVKQPMQYDTIIGENGVNLSGGQKQKIAIARALLKKSKIILLDEATSSLDNETQSNINNIIKSLFKDKTVIIVAHRFAAIKNVDEIIVLDNSQVIAKGTHDWLIKNNSTYKILHDKELCKLG